MFEAIARPAARRGPDGTGRLPGGLADRIDSLPQQHLGLDRLADGQHVALDE